MWPHRVPSLSRWSYLSWGHAQWCTRITFMLVFPSDAYSFCVGLLAMVLAHSLTSRDNVNDYIRRPTRVRLPSTTQVSPIRAFEMIVDTVRIFQSPRFLAAAASYTTPLRPSSSAMITATFSPMTSAVPYVFALTFAGAIDMSATLSPRTPYTFSFASTTPPCSRGFIAQVPS